MPVAGVVLDGKYELIRLVGKGGMGEVWEAEYADLRRVVAVKLLLHELAESDEARSRFLTEAKVSGHIDHDNICEVLDLGVADDDTLYYVMPLLKGTPLDEAIAFDALFSVERACDIAIQMLAALSAAHDAGIVHRDLKPDNVFLTSMGDRDDFVKILDFGIAKALGSTTTCTDGEMTLTKTGTVLGTPYYMAPEQARGAKDLDGRVDVYSVGVMLYEMLTGVRPIEGESPNEVFWGIWLGKIEEPTTHREDLPLEMESVVLKAMARERNERYANAAELRGDLRRALTACGAEGRPTWGSGLHTATSSSDREGRDLPVEGTPGEAVEQRDSPAADIDPNAQTAMGPTTLAKAGVSKGRSRLLLGAIGVVFVALITFVALGLREGNDDDPGVHQQGSLEPEAAALSPPARPEQADNSDTPSVEVSSAEVDAAQSEEGRHHVVTLEGVPEGAQVTADGRAVTETTFEVSSDAEHLRIVVSAPGFDRWERQVRVVGDTLVQVALVRDVEIERRPIRPAKAVPRPPRNNEKQPSRSRPEISTFGEMP